MVRYGARLAESGETDLLSAIQIYDGDGSALKLLEGCERCLRPALKGQDFVRELMDHKFVLNFDGAGNWWGGALRKFEARLTHERVKGACLVSRQSFTFFFLLFVCFFSFCF